MVRPTAAALALMLLVTGTALGADGGKLPFTRDHDAGLQQARETGKPIFLFFTSDG
jgi:hypothetical protein